MFSFWSDNCYLYNWVFSSQDGAPRQLWMCVCQPNNVHSGQKQPANLEDILQANAKLGNNWRRTASQNTTDNLLQIFGKRILNFQV